MKKLLNRCGFLRGRMCRLTCGALCMTVLFLIAVTARADVPKSIEECAKIEDNTKRIQCYDELAGRKAIPSEPTSTAPSVAKPDTKAAQSESTSTVASVTKSDAPTYLERLWELDKESRRGRFAISPHRSNYILPITYVESPNEKPIREDDPRRELKNPEVAFQLSFKAKLWQDVFGQNMDLWVAYTQRSFWQLVQLRRFFAFSRNQLRTGDSSELPDGL